VQHTNPFLPNFTNRLLSNWNTDFTAGSLISKVGGARKHNMYTYSKRKLISLGDNTRTKVIKISLYIWKPSRLVFWGTVHTYVESQITYTYKR